MPFLRVYKNANDELGLLTKESSRKNGVNLLCSVAAKAELSHRDKLHFQTFY